MDEEIAEVVDRRIHQAILKESLEGRGPEPVAFMELDGFAELVDRLAIVNIKLFKLKDLQTEETDEKILAASAKLDVDLCKTRSKLKNALNAKIAQIIQDVCDSDVDFNPQEPEVKVYGKA